jgi:TRAP-type C4-dicarboxylate transport system permease small subunit
MKVLRWLDNNFENTIIFPMYFIMMSLMAIGVVQRFVFKFAWHWGIQVCVGLFVWFAWISCSLNVKQRSHLSVGTVREYLPRKAKFGLLMMDYALWIIFAFVAGYYSIGQIFRLQSMGSLIYGSDLIPKWTEPLSIPVAFGLLVFRVLQCAREDILAMKRGTRLKTTQDASVSIEQA